MAIASSLETSVDLTFCEGLPKVELHAHLSGSVSRSALQVIWSSLPAEDPARSLPPPEEALADEKRAGQSISTFFSLFNNYTHRLLGTLSALKYATRSVLQDFAADGVVHLELRTTPRALSPTTSAEAAVDVILAELEAWNAADSNPYDASLPSPPWRKSTPQGDGQRMKAALLLSIDRARHSATGAEAIADLAITMHKAGRPLVGLDLSGDPAAPAPIVQFAPAFSRARAAGLQLSVHFAELPASSTREELNELISWQPRRLGHCIHVPEDVRERLLVGCRLGLEMCISCNVMAGMLPGAAGGWETAIESADELDVRAGAASHHVRWWLGRGAEVSICTDDVGVFQSPGSVEHLLAAQITPQLDQTGLVALSWTAMSGAFCEDSERRRVRNLIRVFAAQQNLKCPEEEPTEP